MQRIFYIFCFVFICLDIEGEGKHRKNGGEGGMGGCGDRVEEEEK